MDSKYTHREIDEQLVKIEKIKMKLVDISFKVFNTNGIKNGEVIQIVLLEVEINGYKE